MEKANQQYVSGSMFSAFGLRPALGQKVMRIPLLRGRDFRSGNLQPGTAIVNDAIAKEYFGGKDPIGKTFSLITFGGNPTEFHVMGLVANARYRNMREPMRPVAYLPFTADYMRATFVVRTIAANPLTLASTLRRMLVANRPDFNVSNVRTQQELVAAHTIRERLMAMLALFFGAVPLLLAGVGLYGLLDQSVLQRRREIGIRMALGASSRSHVPASGPTFAARCRDGFCIGVSNGFADPLTAFWSEAHGPCRSGCSGENDVAGGTSRRDTRDVSCGTHESGNNAPVGVEGSANSSGPRAAAPETNGDCTNSL
jgi:hypothetical protein